MTRPYSEMTIMVLGAGTYYVPALREIKGLGCRLVVLDRDANAPGFAVADAAEAVDIVDRDGALDAARRHCIDGILAINDFGIRTAAFVAAEMGLIGIDPGNLDAVCDKGWMRDRWAGAGLAQPDYAVITTDEGLEQVAAKIGYPLVLKPTESGGGGRGVSVVRSVEELDWAYQFALPFARNGRLIVESFLDGVEMTVESISYRGQVHVLAMSDKVKPPLRTRVATSLTYPPDLPESTLSDVRRLVEGAVRALGIENGPSHVEVIVTSEGPKLVESGARGGGGHIFSMIVKAVCGVNMARESAGIILGAVPDLAPKHRHGCVYRFFTPPPGILKRVSGLAEATAMPGVLDLGMIKQVGDRVANLSNSLERAGFLVVEGRDRVEALRRADQVERTIRFEIEPESATTS